MTRDEFLRLARKDEGCLEEWPVEIPEYFGGTGKVDVFAK